MWKLNFRFQYKIEKKADSDEEEDEDDDEFGAKKVEEVDDDPIMRKSWFIFVNLNKLTFLRFDSGLR